MEAICPIVVCARNWKYLGSAFEASVGDAPERFLWDEEGR